MTICRNCAGRILESGDGGVVSIGCKRCHCDNPEPAEYLTVRLEEPGESIRLEAGESIRLEAGESIRLEAGEDGRFKLVEGRGHTL